MLLLVSSVWVQPITVILPLEVTALILISFLSGLRIRIAPFSTFTVQVAVLLPSSVVTVITALPSALPVTLPFWSTSAIPELPEVQVIFLLLAFAGLIVALNA